MIALLQTLASKRAFSSSVRLRTWKKLEAHTRHGLDLEYSLRLLRDQAVERKKISLARQYNGILDLLGTGRTLDVALAPCAPPEEVMLIGGGQASGRLSEGFRLAVNLIEARKKITDALINALTYPCVLFVIGIGLLLLVSVSVIPTLALVSNPKTWTGSSAVLYGLASFVASPLGVTCLVGFIGLVLMLFVTLPFWTGSLRLVADRFPPWSIYRLTVGSGWLFTVATLMRSGISSTHILDVMIESENTTPYLRERILAVAEQCGRGKNLAEGLAMTKLCWPDPELVDDLCVYAGLPGFHYQIHELATEWMVDGIVQIQKQAGLLKVGLLSLIVAFILLLMLALSSLQQNLSTGIGGY
ncbi:MAG: type II secretion system F family protein [Bilophila sp.]